MTVSSFVKNLEEHLRHPARIGLIGFGVTCRALYGRLSPLGVEISVRCRDAAVIPDGVRGHFGDEYLAGIYEDALLLSPSVRRDHPALLDAERRGVLVSSDCEIFFSGLESTESMQPQVFTVSGSDGKTTVTKMTAEMLDAEAVGNVGIPFCEREGCARYVAELSSFNLNHFAPPSLRCALTCITPNHLNWHLNFDEYRAAKANALRNAQHAVLSADDEGSRSLIRGGETLFSLRRSREELVDLGAAHAVYVQGGAVFYDGEQILPITELSLCEGHNIMNFMAAVGLAHGYADVEQIRAVGRGFRAPAHRCELVHTDARGVRYVDSSIDTTPTRTATTLAGLNRRVLLLLGGRGKGLSPLPLREALLKYAEAIAVYGDWREELVEFLNGDGQLCRIPCTVAVSFEDALLSLCEQASAGDTVLLSPAATAYGQFENYEKRGEAFTALVKAKYQ